MSVNRYDIVLDGISLRIDRTRADSYIRGWQRVSLQEQVVGATTREMATSRPDQRVMHQTSWAGGATWWKPILSAETADFYHVGNNMDAFRTPGLVYPCNKVTVLTTDILECGRVFRRWNNVYAVGASQTNDPGYYDCMYWNPVTGDWGILVDDISTATANDTIYDVITRVPTGWTYLLSSTKINRFKMGNADEDKNWVDLDPDCGVTAGMRIMREGRVFVYRNGTIYELTIAGDVGTLEEISDDGLGEDVLSQGGVFTSATKIGQKNDFSLFDAGADGIYWVHNTMENGRPRPWIFKLDRDATGIDVCRPLGSLPSGTVALNMMIHMGSLVITATPDLFYTLKNDTTRGYPRIDVWHYTQGYIGLIGSFDAKQTGATESPFRILGSDGPYVFFGSHKQVWAYDSIKGGLHTWLNMVDITDGVYRDITVAERPDGVGQMYLISGNGKTYKVSTARADPTTVANFNTDDTTYYLESNYFDFQLPLEYKTLTRCALQTEALTANQQYRLYVSVDDGAWTLVLTHTNATIGEADLSGSSLTGMRFRYKFIFETKDAAIPGVMAVQFDGATGYMLPTWNLRFDAGSAINAEGAPIRPDDVYDSFETSAVKETVVTLLDYFRSDDASDYSTHRTKFQSVQIIKNTPGEAIIEVSLLGM